jgi:hypothetical protein
MCSITPPHPNKNQNPCNPVPYVVTATTHRPGQTYYCSRPVSSIPHRGQPGLEPNAVRRDKLSSLPDAARDKDMTDDRQACTSSIVHASMRMCNISTGNHTCTHAPCNANARSHRLLCFPSPCEEGKKETSNRDV